MQTTTSSSSETHASGPATPGDAPAAGTAPRQGPQPGPGPAPLDGRIRDWLSARIQLSAPGWAIAVAGLVLVVVALD